MSRPPKLQQVSLALASAVLLIASFPNVNQPWCAWIALVPWLVLLRRNPHPFRWSWLTGFLFFLGSMWWLVHVTIIAWVILCASLAVYFGIFAWIARRALIVQRASVLKPLVLAALWVVLEYLRSHLLSGLGWNLLAYSQTSWRLLIQCADLTGAWGVSFLIVLVNTAIATWLTAETPRKGRMTAVRIAAAAMLAAISYGAWRLPQVAPRQTVRVAVVQGNIPQEEKWDEGNREWILERYESLTNEASKDHPQLIVWPETSVPGFLGLEEPMSSELLKFAGGLKAPLLVGAPRSTFNGTAWRTTNAAMLLEQGGIRRWYDKLHLVPFGEFIPLERQLPWLRRVLPPIGDFAPGHDETVFSINRSRFEVQGSRATLEPSALNLELKFSVLICFEDVFPDLARRFVRRGAQALIVITNDAWFGPTAAAYQHAQASIFRAVELRVPVVRAANTGWSGCMTPSGWWLGSVQDESGAELFVEGHHTCELPLGPAESVYLRWGDWFATGCLLLLFAWGGLIRKHT